MQMLMIVVESTHKEKVEAALTEHAVLGYTEIPTVYGAGRTGMRLGSRAFPETSSIIFTVVEKEKVDELLADIDAQVRRLPREDADDRLGRGADGVTRGLRAPGLAASLLQESFCLREKPRVRVGRGPVVEDLLSVLPVFMEGEQSHRAEVVGGGLGR